MGFRFWRRIKVAPGLTLNLSKSGGSLSLGPRGGKFTVGPRGPRATLGLTGTGLFYTTTFPQGKSGRRRTTSSLPTARKVAPERRLTLGFFQRLITPADEEALVDGCRELALGNEARAFSHLENAVHLADGAYLAGFLALKLGRLDDAAAYLTGAAKEHRRLGRYLTRYGIDARLELPITDEITAAVGPDLSGVLLGLVEVYQRREQWPEAIGCLTRLLRLNPDEVVVKLSLAELLLAAKPDDKRVYRGIVQQTAGLKNETPVHAALLLYKARALRGLGLLDAARETLTAALRRKKGRPAELLLALRYERGLVYGGLGQQRQARRDFQHIYAADPNYSDVASRLGI